MDLTIVLSIEESSRKGDHKDGSCSRLPGAAQGLRGRGQEGLT